MTRPILTALAAVTPPPVRRRLHRSTLAMSRGRCVECGRRVRTRHWVGEIEHGQIFPLHPRCAGGRRSWRHTAAGELVLSIAGGLAVAWTVAAIGLVLVT